jgi:hypothetical protein
MLQQSKLNDFFGVKVVAITIYVKIYSLLWQWMGKLLKRFGLVINHHYFIHEYLGVMHMYIYLKKNKINLILKNETCIVRV